MKPSSSNMTLEQFQSLSSEQRRAMPLKERGPFYAQEAANNINRAVREQDAKDQQQAEKAPA